MSVSIQTNHDIVEFDQKKLDIIRNSFCKEATQDEFEVFIEICKSTQLNPLFKQIYFIKRGGKPTHQTSIDGLRLIADRTKKYVPGREPTYVYDKSGKLFSATSYVKKLASDGSWHEVAATAMLSEYKADNQWNKMPHVMLSKCAEALALRRAFPADMLGVLTKDEMEQAEHEEAPKVINVPEEIISIDECHDIENLLANEDKQYRQALLAFVSGKRNMEPPMLNFFGMPKKYLAPLLDSIHRKRNGNKKTETVEVMSDSETSELL